MPSTVSSDRIAHVFDYAWAGTAGKSKSTLTRDGVLARRNECTNPGFEIDVTGWNASGLTTTSYAWTGTADASTSTQTVNGTVRRTNLATNPRFAIGTDTWFLKWNGQSDSDVSRGDYGAPGGGLALVVTPTGQGTGVEWQPDVTTGRQVYLSMWVARGKNVAIKMYGGPTGQAMVPVGSARGDWQRYASPTPVTTNSAGKFYIDVYGDQGVTFYIANTMIEEASSVGTYFDGSTAGGTSGVQVYQSTATAHSGSASLEVRYQSPSGSTPYASTTISNLQQDTDYVVSMWVSIPRALAKPVNLGVVLDSLSDLPNHMVTLQAATAGWVRVVIPVRTLVARTGFSIWLYDPNSYTGTYLNQSVYIDDVLVETGGAELPYFDGSFGDYVEYEHVNPLVIDGWQEAATGGNVVNPIIGGGVDVTLLAASLRTGAFEMVFEDEDDAAFAFAMHQKPSTFTVTDTDRGSIGMRYVVDGQLSRQLDDQTRDYWIVRVEYQEVPR